LLDGLDEVIPLHEKPMRTILKCLLNRTHNEKDNLVLKRLVLTTRPHLQKELESKWKVASYSLKPFTPDEQTDLLVKLVNRQNVFTKSIADRKLRELIVRSTSDDVMSNPLMLTLYSQKSFTKNINLFYLYSEFVNIKYKVFVADKAKVGLQPFFSQLQQDHFKYYNYLAIKLLIGESQMNKIMNVSSNCSGDKVIAIPNENKFKELLDVEIVKGTIDHVEFQHKVLAEFFYARIILDVGTTPKKLIDILFKVGFNCEENIPKFISSGYELNMVQKGKLSRYETDDNYLIDHILSNSMNFKSSTAAKQIVILSIYKDDCFVSWLQKQVTRYSWVRSKMFWITEDDDEGVCENMREVVVALVLSRGTPIELSAFLCEREIKEAILKCEDVIPIAIRLKYEQLLPNNRENLVIYSDSLRERLMKWLSEPKQIAAAINSAFMYPKKLLHFQNRLSADKKESEKIIEPLAENQLYDILNENLQKMTTPNS